MTLVHVVLTVPTLSGVDATASGVLRFTPTARRIKPGKIILPAAFQVPLVAGAADVTLDPTTALWVWQVDEYLTGVPARTAYVQVPNVAEKDYTELVSVDPSTLTPGPTLAPAWSAAMDLQLARTPEAIITGAITYTNGAPTSATVVWPDGTAGVFTGTPSATFPGSLDSYTITYGTTRTYTQPTVTRDANGDITNQPAIVLS